jgi:UDP-N-acetylmuramoyl-tripeptide--D-alanyl-D-alanine ligase
MTGLWTGEAMAEAMDGRPVGALPEIVTDISIDSRTLKPGQAFFAIKGEKFDGHDFATSAMAAGASVLVVAEAKLPALGRLRTPMIVVDDVSAALVRLGMASRKRTGARIVAVTGSAGKTTTKEALRHVLGPAGKVHAADKSFNNHWGVPLSLARMPADADFGIFEIGMNHPGEIRELVRLVRPHLAIITLIAAAHIGHFRNLEEIAHAKAEIFEGVIKGGHALINRDDRHYALLARLARAAGVAHIHGFGEHRRARYMLESLEAHGSGSRMTARIAGRPLSARIGAPGRHMALNALAVLGAVDLIGGDVEAAAERLGDFSAESGRGRQYRLKIDPGTLTLIDESYNANPASMAAALEILSMAPVGQEGRRIAVLGDMLELGVHSAKLHASLAAAFKDRRIDMAFLGGRDMRHLAEVLPGEIHVEYRESLEELMPLVLDTLRAGDAVMVKSSKSVGFSRIVAAILEKYPTPETAESTA